MKVLEEKGKYQFHCEPRFENAFSVLVTYLYKGYVPACPTEDGPESTAYGRQMRELYYLAERFEIIDLMDKTMDAIQAHDCRFDRDVHKHMSEIYKNTIRNSCLRFYCALSAAWYFSRSSRPNSQKLKRLETFKDKADILYDVIKTQLRFENNISNATSDYRVPSEESGLDICAFHAHAKGEMCYRMALLECPQPSRGHEYRKQINAIGIMHSQNDKKGVAIEEHVDGSISISGSPEAMNQGDDGEELLILTREKSHEKKATTPTKIKKESGEEDNVPDQTASTIIVEKKPRSESPILGSRESVASHTEKRPLEGNYEDSASRKRPFVIIGGDYSQDRRSEPAGPIRNIQKLQMYTTNNIRKGYNRELSTANIKPRTSVILNRSSFQTAATRNDSCLLPPD